MASRELYSSIGKPKKKYTFGQKLGDVGKLYADTMLSTLGASDVISDDAYKGEWAEKASGILSPIAGVAGQIGLAAATGGAGNAALSAAKAVGPAIFAKGGLRTFEGNSHEEGGIPLGQDEVEGNETMVPMDSQSDFIFSDRLYPIKSISPKGKITFSKKSFAQLSKQINKPLELRPNDPYSKKTVDMKLGKLAEEQELLKQVNQANEFAMGGKRYFGGGGFDFKPKMFDPLWRPDSSGIDNYTFGKEFNDIYNPLLIDSKVAPLTSIAPESDYGPPEFDYGEEEEKIPYKSNFLPAALGYAAQAATNLPAFFMKPDTVNLPRVKFDDISLAEQRNEARRSRNLGLASARGIGGNDTGQMMNYLSGTTAGMNSVYGNQFNQSLMQEKQINAETNMREQLANSQIGMQEEQINTAEKDAIRNLKMQALSNIGTSAAMAGKGYIDMQQGDAQINAYGKANPYYAANNEGVYRKEGSRFDGGGKRKKDPISGQFYDPLPEGVTISRGPMQGEVPISGQFYDPTKHPLYPNIDNNTYYGRVLPPAEIIATPQTPVYRGDPQSRIEDARTLPGYENLASRGRYPEKVRADMMKATLQQPIDPFAQGMQKFAMAAAGAASPGTPALSNWAKAGIAATGLGGGTALRYSDNEAAQNLGEYMQLIGAVEGLPLLGKGLGLIPPLAKGAFKFVKKIPPALKKATKASAKFVKDNPRTLYAPALGAKYGYDSYINKKNKNEADIENMYKEVPSEVTNKILENIRKERK